MKKTIRISALLLLLALAASLLSACGPAAGGEDTTAQPHESSEPSELTSELTTEPLPETTAEESAEVKAFKAAVCEFLNAEDDRESPRGLLLAVCGDYYADSFGDSNDFAASLGYIAQKNGVTHMSYKNGMTTYSFARDGYMFTAQAENGKCEVNGMQQLASANFVPSIFYDFGIDISDMLAESEIPDGVDAPVLMPDMVIPSDDLTYCTFSEEYMTRVIKYLAASSGYTGADLEKLEPSGKGGGKYIVADGSVSFDIEFYAPGIGDMKVSFTQSETEAEGLTVKQVNKYNVTSNGMSVPTTVEMTFSQIKYDGTRPVSGSFCMNVTAEASAVSEGYTVSSVSAASTQVWVDITGEAPSFYANSETELVVEYAGQKQTSSMQIYLRGNGKSFHYFMSQDNTELASLLGKISFGTPDIPDMPEELEAEARSLINQQSLM